MSSSVTHTTIVEICRTSPTADVRIVNIIAVNHVVVVVDMAQSNDMCENIEGSATVVLEITNMNRVAMYFGTYILLCHKMKCQKSIQLSILRK